MCIQKKQTIEMLLNLFQYVKYKDATFFRDICALIFVFWFHYFDKKEKYFCF